MPEEFRVDDRPRDGWEPPPACHEQGHDWGEIRNGVNLGIFYGFCMRCCCYRSRAMTLDEYEQARREQSETNGENESSLQKGNE